MATHLLNQSYSAKRRKRRLARWCLWLFAFAFWTLPATAAPKPEFELPKLPSFDDPNSEIQITADRIGANREEHLATLTGNVHVTFADITMTCDYATYDESTGNIHAEGDVKIDSTAGGSWRGDSIDFNHKTGEGLIGAGTLKLSGITMIADSMVRDDDNILHAKDALITTCANEEQHDWHWSIRGDGRCKEKEFYELSDAVLRFCDIPILWFPYYYRDLNTSYGWRFLPGYSSKGGAFLKTGYVYPIAGDLEGEAHVYGKSVLDLRSEYGVAVGQELTWRDDAIGDSEISHRGRAKGYFAFHSDEQDAEDAGTHSEFDDYRWSLGLEEFITITPRDTFSIIGEVTSDDQFREDYDELSVRSASQPIGIANYEHRENEWVTSVSVSGPLESFYAGTRRLPEVRFDLLPRNNVFGFEKLTYDTQNSVARLERQPAKYRRHILGTETPAYHVGNWAYYDTFRFDTRHMFRRPFEVSNGVTFTPRLGWRGTFYTDSDSGDNLFRSLFEVGGTLQARLWRDYDTYRHTMIPYADFTAVLGPSQSADDVPYAFDRTEGAYDWRDRFGTPGYAPTHRYAGLRLGIKNILQKRNETYNVLSKTLDFDVYSIFVMQTEDHWNAYRHLQNRTSVAPHTIAHRINEDTGLRVIGFSSTYTPSRDLALNLDVQFDPENSTFSVLNFDARIQVDPITLYVGYLQRDYEVYDYYWTDVVDDALFYGGFIHPINDAFEWSLYWRYNTEYTDLEEIGGYLQYNLDCISFRFNVGYIPSYTSESYYNENKLYKHSSDVSFSFGIWLRAFPTVEEDDWLDWGNLSNVRAIEEK
ncbi:MAG: hypothetical protein Q4C03_01250 [bacterium]|nr:hypothetical protein [bacterium]